MNKLFWNSSLLFVLVLCLLGCSTPHYGVRPKPLDNQQLVTIGKFDLIKEQGHSVVVATSMEVLDFLDKKYLYSWIVITNIAATNIQASFDAATIACKADQNGQKLLPFEPESLIKQLAKERASKEKGRKWGTVFLTMAAAHHAPGESADLAGTQRTAQSRSRETRSQAVSESDMVAYLDRCLLRRGYIAPTKQAAGCILFPFVKSENYTLNVQVCGESLNFNFQLRSY